VRAARPVAVSGSRERALTVFVVTLAHFMAVMPTSSVSVALPTIGRDLHASSTSLEWVVDAYVIVYASLLIAGGVLSDRQGRKGMLLLNVPLAALIICLGVFLIPRIPCNRGVAGFDRTGAFLTTSGVGLLTFALIEGPKRGWSSVLIIGSFVLSALGLAVFVAWESRHPAPLIDVLLFRRAPFTVANLAGLTVFFAFIGAIVYLSAYFQQVEGRSALGAGLAVLPIGVGFFVSAQVSGRIVGRVGPRLPMVLGLGLCGVAMIGLLRLRSGSQISQIWWDLLAVGFGGGLSLTR